MINLTSLYIAIAIIITELNIGTMIFLNRNKLEKYSQKYMISIIPIPKEEQFNQLKLSEEKVAPISKISFPTSEISTEFCPYCGTKVELDHNFCRKCGNPLKKKKGQFQE